MKVAKDLNITEEHAEVVIKQFCQDVKKLLKEDKHNSISFVISGTFKFQPSKTQINYHKRQKRNEEQKAKEILNEGFDDLRQETE